MKPAPTKFTRDVRRTAFIVQAACASCRSILQELSENAQQIHMLDLAGVVADEDLRADVVAVSRELYALRRRLGELLNKSADVVAAAAVKHPPRPGRCPVIRSRSPRTFGGHYLPDEPRPDDSSSFPDVG